MLTLLLATLQVSFFLKLKLHVMNGHPLLNQEEMLPVTGQLKNFFQLLNVPWVVTIECCEYPFSSSPHSSIQEKSLTLRLLPPYAWRKLKHGDISIRSHGANMNNSSPVVPVYVVNTKHTNTSTHKSGTPIGAIIGSVAGAVLLVILTLVLVCMSLLRTKKYTSQQSETGSSDHSMEVVWARRPDSPLVVGHGPTFPEVQTARHFTLAELELAAKQWSYTNLIGGGRFGLVYKGILEDGTIVAIKKRRGVASQEFAAEVSYLGHVRHKHLVILIGLCQESEQQMVVYDYIPNGNVSSHLYDDNGHPLGQLDFKRRLSIALGAARGLEHLHALVPPLAHTDFKTSNVLVDENFLPKVTDFGISRLTRVEEVTSTSTSRMHTAEFQDPELPGMQAANERSDVYSFGVFLLELISGRKALISSRPELEQSLAKYLLERRELGELVDDKMGGQFTEQAIKSIMEIAFKCVELVAEKRPSMKEIVKDLENIMAAKSQFAPGIEGLASVALGSELFSRTA
ncbi:hypothetical protein L7F22_010949 [Adiantum nelumboides]|nr:hypothetical protein [Adiantum nelumboides]